MGRSHRELSAQGTFAEAVGERQKRAEQDSRERFAKAEAWAKRELPDEFAPFAASAALTLMAGKRKITAAAVRERLVAQGRDHKSVAERRRRYAAMDEGK